MYSFYYASGLINGFQFGGDLTNTEIFLIRCQI